MDCKDGKGKVTLHERVSDIEFSLRSLHPKDPVLGMLLSNLNRSCVIQVGQEFSAMMCHARVFSHHVSCHSDCIQFVLRL